MLKSVQQQRKNKVWRESEEALSWAILKQDEMVQRWGQIGVGCYAGNACLRGGCFSRPTGSYEMVLK